MTDLSLNSIFLDPNLYTAKQKLHATLEQQLMAAKTIKTELEAKIRVKHFERNKLWSTDQKPEERTTGRDSRKNRYGSHPVFFSFFLSFFLCLTTHIIL